MDDDLHWSSFLYASWIFFSRNWTHKTKDTVNILFKNFFVITIGLLMYAIGGFNLMYPGFEEGSLGFLNLLDLVAHLMGNDF